MSGNDPNYYNSQYPMYPAGYNWTSWAPDGNFSYPPPSTTAAGYMRNHSNYSYSSPYSSPMPSPSLNTSNPGHVSNPSSSSRASDSQGPVNRNSSYYHNSHNYYNRQFNGSNYSSSRNNRNSNYKSKDFWQGKNSYKRPHDNSDDHKTKPKGKKKKSLAESTPKTKDWSLEDSIRALEVEKQHNKMFKNHSLIIKFPDLELNKDIVSKFHNCIENVHFQQPSTARFCFVTLKKDSDAESVIKEINSIQFGNGHLQAEYKKDREEEQVISPEDIDPFTLYVGNLAQEVTKEDMTNMFPKCKRIDIGYAKKMKYTRYAFVSFRKVDDAIEAFQTTRSRDLHSKSLIVRFRRLKGTVGMPGETKAPNPPREMNEEENTDYDLFKDNMETNYLQPSAVKQEPLDNDDGPEDYPFNEDHGYGFPGESSPGRYSPAPYNDEDPPKIKSEKSEENLFTESEYSNDIFADKICNDAGPLESFDYGNNQWHHKNLMSN